jgi:hypothetical protein
MAVENIVPTYNPYATTCLEVSAVTPTRKLRVSRNFSLMQATGTNNNGLFLAPMLWKRIFSIATQWPLLDTTRGL